uniref:tetrahydrofolate synthase n=1 Tax=Corethron hystrix TaxID=216773 RepID=A0A7S1B8Q7_9STRA|mmetsp:Transcript_16896/g.38013  ORF Transcript_16896/g.38013 Transcript_16896/m.38013 type:complete len:508 (+) Transcript_16896:113-1636(+)
MTHWSPIEAHGHSAYKNISECPPPSYESTLKTLFASHVASDRSSILRASSRRKMTLSDMSIYMHRIGLISSLKPATVIHVTGTKGKGSTCAFAESLCRKICGRHTGMLTSPHLLDVRERIRLDGLPVSEENFVTAYWNCRKHLEKYEGTDGLPILPGYFRMLTLVGLYVLRNHIFPDGRGVEVAILEVGMGGRYDATSVVETDVRAVGWIDLDHTRILGDNCQKIAWEKGGIFRKNGTNLALDQGMKRESILEVLRGCAKDVEGDFTIVPQSGALSSSLKLGLPGHHQLMNAHLAVAAVEAAIGPLKSYDDALSSVYWPGRCQILPYGNNAVIYTDGAHTEKSMEHCLEWFKCASTKHQRQHKAMIFYCHHERDPVGMFRVIVDSGVSFENVYFCPGDDTRPSSISAPSAQELLERNGMGRVKEKEGSEPLSWEETLKVLWRAVVPEGEDTKLHTEKEVIKCLSLATSGFNRTDILVTGSLYVVGSALKACNYKEKDAKGRLVFQKK